MKNTSIQARQATPAGMLADMTLPNLTATGIRAQDGGDAPAGDQPTEGERQSDEDETRDDTVVDPDAAPQAGDDPPKD